MPALLTPRSEIAAVAASGTDDQLLDSYLLLEVMPESERPLGYFAAVGAILAEINCNRHHLVDALDQIAAELDALDEIEMAS